MSVEEVDALDKLVFGHPAELIRKTVVRERPSSRTPPNFYKTCTIRGCLVGEGLLR
jgi:hypothetical protein